MLEGIVPDEINRRTISFIDQNGHRPLLVEDWFIDNVFLNCQVVGIIRSLLGSDFKLPVKLSNHRELSVRCQLRIGIGTVGHATVVN